MVWQISRSHRTKFQHHPSNFKPIGAEKSTVWIWFHSGKIARQLSGPSDLLCYNNFFKYGTCICYSMCICLTIHISYSVATACILCMISFSISYIYKYYLNIHRSPQVAHTDWCAERTKSAPTNAHQKRTYRCAPKAHLQVRSRCAPKAHLPLIYIFAPAPVKSAPTGAHLEVRTYRCAPKVHQKHTYRCAPKAHLPLIYVFAPTPKAHLPLYKCMKNSEDSAPNTHVYERTYWVGA